MSSTDKYQMLIQPGSYTSTGAITFYTNPFVLSSTETLVSMYAPKMILNKMVVNIFGNTFNNTLSITFRVNEADVGSTLTWAAGETGTKTVSFSDAVVEKGSLICVKMVVVATSGSVSFARGGLTYG